MTVDIERLSAAERLLWSYGVTRAAHIDLEGIANDHGALVKYRRLGGCEARLVALDDHAVITINSSSAPGRRRFSLGHELAHWICDRKTGAFLCAQEDISPRDAGARAVEAAANAYASQLIMPSYLVVPWLTGRKLNLETAARLKEDFDTSLTAAALKIVKCALAPVAVLCHSQTSLMWHQRSDSFPDFYFMPELSADTRAFTLAFGKVGGMTCPERETANRWASGKQAYIHEVMSQSVRLPDGKVLTMLALANR